MAWDAGQVIIDNGGYNVSHETYQWYLPSWQGRSEWPGQSSMINTGIQYAYGTVNINSETAALSSLFFGYLPIIMVTLMQMRSRYSKKMSHLSIFFTVFGSYLLGLLGGWSPLVPVGPLWRCCCSVLPPPIASHHSRKSVMRVQSYHLCAFCRHF